MNQDELLKKVNRVLGRDFRHSTLMETVDALVQMVETERLDKFTHFNQMEELRKNEEMLLEQNKELRLKIRDFRSKTTYKVYEENLRLAQEIVRLKGELGYVQTHPYLH